MPFHVEAQVWVNSVVALANDYTPTQAHRTHFLKHDGAISRKINMEPEKVPLKRTVLKKRASFQAPC